MNKKKLVNALTSKTAIIFYVTIAVTAYFGATTSGFLGIANIRSLMVSMSTTGIIGVGITLMLLAGETDLSAGYEGCMGGVAVVYLIRWGVPWPLAIVLALLFGAVMGTVLVLSINRANLPGFIITMVMMNVYKGLTLVITKAQNIPVDQSHAAFYTLGSGMIFGIPMPFFIMVVLMVVYGFILNNTEFGRKVYMYGGNRNAARLCGVEKNKMVRILYINCAVVSSLAGIVVAARMHNCAHNATESGATDAITAAVLGGVAFKGGAGRMICTFIGAALVTIFQSGLVASGLPAYWQVVVKGLLLIAALCVDYFNEKARAKELDA